MTAQSITSKGYLIYPSGVAAAAAPLLALSNGEVILIVALAAIPIAGLAFVAGAGNAFRQIGKGRFSVEFADDLPQKVRDSDAEASPDVREEEIRQRLEAKAYRQSSRGGRCTLYCRHASGTPQPLAGQTKTYRKNGAPEKIRTSDPCSRRFRAISLPKTAPLPPPAP